MSFGAGYGNGWGQAGGPFRPEDEDEAEQTFEFRRPTPGEAGTWPPPARPPIAPPHVTPPQARPSQITPHRVMPPRGTPPLSAWPTAGGTRDQLRGLAR